MEELEIVLEEEDNIEEEIELISEISIVENLTPELTEQDRLITYQKDALLEAIEKLQVKTGSGGLVSVEEYYLEGTILHILLSNGQTLVIDLSENEDTEFTIQELEEMIISKIENKTIGEVES